MKLPEEITDEKLKDLVQQTIKKVKEGARSMNQKPHEYLESFLWYYLLTLLGDETFTPDEAIMLLELCKFKLLRGIDSAE